MMHICYVSILNCQEKMNTFVVAETYRIQRNDFGLSWKLWIRIKVALKGHASCKIMGQVVLPSTQRNMSYSLIQYIINKMCWPNYEGMCHIRKKNFD